VICGKYYRQAEKRLRGRAHTLKQTRSNIDLSHTMHPFFRKVVLANFCWSIIIIYILCIGNTGAASITVGQINHFTFGTKTPLPALRSILELQSELLMCSTGFIGVF
jgi:hypothetical protein